VAPMYDRHLMDKSSSSGSNVRDLLTVDLRGLKPALVELASARGMSVSMLVRGLLVDAGFGDEAIRASTSRAAHRAGDRVRISLRVSREEAENIHKRADLAGLPIGTYMLELLHGTGTPATSADRIAFVAALTRSNAELSTMSRNIAHLTTLLRQGAVRAAQEYRVTLDALDGDVRAHLALAARVLVDPSLRPHPTHRRSSHA